MADDVSRKVSRGLGLLVLRIGAGLIMMSHGWGKMEKVFAGDFSFPDPLGIGAGLSLVLAAGAEFVLAGFVVVGLATRLSSAPIVFTMMVAAFIQHGGDGFAKQEMAILYALMFLVLTLTGPGKFSADAMLWPMVQRRQARRKAK